MHLARRPSDAEWATFLSVVQDNQPVIREYWRFMETAFQIASMKLGDKFKPDANIDDFAETLNAITIGKSEQQWLGMVSSGAKIATSAGVDAAAHAGHIAPKVITLGGRALGTAAEKELAEFKQSVGKFMWRRTTRNALMHVASRLRLPG
jgi:hypothetical protein